MTQEQPLDYGPQPEPREIVLPPTLKEVSDAIEQAAQDETQQQLARRATELLASFVASWRGRRDELREISKLPQATLVELNNWFNADFSRNPFLMSAMVEEYSRNHFSPSNVFGPFAKHEKPFLVIKLMPGHEKRAALGSSTALRGFIERITENLGTLNQLGKRYLEYLEQTALQQPIALQQIAPPSKEKPGDTATYIDEPDIEKPGYTVGKAAHFLPTKFPVVYLNIEWEKELPPYYWLSVDLEQMDKILAENN